MRRRRPGGVYVLDSNVCVCVPAVSRPEPTVKLIEELQQQNVFWTAQQLEMMSADTFSSTVGTFGAVDGFAGDQLAVLARKVTEVRRRNGGDLVFPPSEDTQHVLKRRTHRSNHYPQSVFYL